MFQWVTQGRSEHIYSKNKIECEKHLPNKWINAPQFPGSWVRKSCFFSPSLAMFWRRRGATMRHCKDWLNDVMMIPEAKKHHWQLIEVCVKVEGVQKESNFRCFFWIFSLNKDVLQLASSRSVEKSKCLAAKLETTSSSYPVPKSNWPSEHRFGKSSWKNMKKHLETHHLEGSFRSTPHPVTVTNAGI